MGEKSLQKRKKIIMPYLKKENKSMLKKKSCKSGYKKKGYLKKTGEDIKLGEITNPTGRSISGSNLIDRMAASRLNYNSTIKDLNREIDDAEEFVADVKRLNPTSKETGYSRSSKPLKKIGQIAPSILGKCGSSRH